MAWDRMDLAVLMGSIGRLFSAHRPAFGTDLSCDGGHPSPRCPHRSMAWSFACVVPRGRRGPAPDLSDGDPLIDDEGPSRRVALRALIYLEPFVM